jgi:predicted DCC family thiol-disulfide oxidoreductase YuxK
MEAKDSHKETLLMYDEHCMLCQAVHSWAQKFSEGRAIIEDVRAGREQCARGSDSNQKNFTPQVSRDL